MFTTDDIYVFVFSWKKVTTNATQLFTAVAPHFPHTFFVNCDEHTSADQLAATGVLPTAVIQRDDRYYYGGQFDAAMKQTPTGKICAVIVGDVSPRAPWAAIAENAVAAFNTDKVGIYAPNVDYTWHIAKGAHLWDNLFTVPNTDCTCWFLHPSLLKRLARIPYFVISNLGWGIDTIFIKEAERLGLQVARDYSVLVRQPQGTAYDQRVARIQMQKLLELYAAMRV
jgi:hypothetical protein